MVKILVVEDEESIRGLWKMMLENSGYEVATAANGPEAVEKFEREKPDLVLLDVILPRMNGIAVCKELKNRMGNTGEVPVIMCTVLEDEDHRKMAKEAGCDGYFVKCSPADLVREVKKYLKST
ncbi:MAG TPA: response regulator [Candidatus Acidoferrales bacterium]|nr:response regulator [Candidatus Acidoferrales bacterium]